TTWAGRNPKRPIQVPRPAARELTKAEQASRAIAAKEKKVMKQQIKDDIDEYLQDQLYLVALAAKHNVTLDYMKKQVSSEMNYKTTCAPNIYNVIVYAKSLEINIAMYIKNLKELQNIASKTTNSSDLNQEEREELCNHFLEQCKVKITGSHANNTAVARDMMLTAERIGREFDNLALRTGAYGCFFLTCGHIYNTGTTTWYGSDNLMDFWEDIIGRDPDELAMLFEQWACSQNQNNLANCRQQCTRLCGSGLRNLLKRKTKMVYKQYDQSIVATHGVKIIGWPEDVPFVNPSAIGTMAEIHKLQDAWKTGTCHWVKLSSAQLQEHKKQLDARLRSGEVTRKKRKKHSDAGLPRKRCQVARCDENEGIEQGGSRVPNTQG
ncbi:hypothetical protein SERLA73DRAFT_59238, partial [Serpula lacrymans var. lacrymans S7.3]